MVKISIFDKIRGKFNKKFRNYSLSDFEKAFNEFFYGTNQVNSQSGQNLTTVSTCINVISNDIALLPLELRKYRDIEKPELGSDVQYKHPVNNILKFKANEYVTSFNFKETLMSDLLLSGNSYWRKILNSRGEVINLNRFEWENVEIFEKNKQIYYKYTYQTGEGETIIKVYPRWEILHVAGFGNGFIGKSPLAIKMESIEIAANAEKFAKNFYKQGLNIGGVITMPGKIRDPEGLRKELKEKYTGIANAHKVMVLEDGMTFNKMVMPLAEAQFIETRKFQARDIASWYRLPPKMIGDHEFSTYSNNEQQELDYVKHALLPWTERLENFLQCYLLTERNLKQGYFIQFDFNKLLKPDAKTLAEVNHVKRQDGVITANEWRAQNGENPRSEKEADMLIVNGNMRAINIVNDVNLTDDKGGITFLEE